MMKQFRKMNTFYYEISLARELQFAVFKKHGASNTKYSTLGIT
jgi:hypothetical protein